MDEIYKSLPHTADVKLQVEGKTLNEVFEKAAYALIDTTVDIGEVEPKEKVEIEVTGSDLYELLYNFLEELIIMIDADSMVFSKFKVDIWDEEDGYRLKAVMWGEKLDLEKHNPKIHIKAATYHEMEIKKVDEKYIASFVLDI